jgi:hypothetical protein
MEPRLVINKSLRRAALLLGLPRFKANRIRATTNPTPHYPHLNMEAARDALQHSLNPNDIRILQQRVEAIQDGKLHIFCDPPVLRNPGVFLRHPRTGRQEPLIPWTRVRIKSAGCDEDIKFLWELNRLGDLDSLLALAVLENRKDCLETAQDLVGQWARENPFGMGVNWFSNMEVALRLLRLLLLQGVTAAFGENDLFVKSLIADHAAHVRADWQATRKNLRGGNHLLVELAALAAYEALIGDHGQACGELETEMKRQFHGDGGYFEGSLGYHLYVLNVLVFVHWLCLLAERQTPVHEVILNNALDFAEQFCGPEGSVPKIGDWDEGYVFSPVFSHTTNPQPMLALGRFLTRTGKIAHKKEAICIFPETKMACWRTGLDDLIVFRAGDVDFGHAHLDMLSIYYMGPGGPVILDAGTFQYNYSREKRNQYRGLSAHSTIVADGLWPIHPLMTFSWRGKLRTALDTGNNWVRGSYRVGKDVRIQRTVQFHVDGLTLLDECQGPYPFLTQFIVPQASMAHKKVLIHDFNEKHILTIYPQTDIAAKIAKIIFSDCYGKEKEVCTVTFPIIKSLELKINYDNCK